MTPEQIVDKILPEKKPNDYVDMEHFFRGYNQARQDLLSTYGKEWVAMPSVDEIGRYIYEAKINWFERKNLGCCTPWENADKDEKEMSMFEAESILAKRKERICRFCNKNIKDCQCADGSDVQTEGAS